MNSFQVVQKAFEEIREDLGNAVVVVDQAAIEIINWSVGFGFLWDNQVADVWVLEQDKKLEDYAKNHS